MACKSKKSLVAKRKNKFIGGFPPMNFIKIY
jgi:hypothetical protein